MRSQLYRCFDSDHRLLYIGISTNALARLMVHRESAYWFAQIATVTIEHFDSRDDAAVEEQLAIMTENPLHNQVYNPRYRR
jgi:predicted GIY-YIG superfamily endonuclease